jgi:hypothetical protein
MTRRSKDPYAGLYAAADAYRRHFNEALGIWGIMGRPEAAAQALRDAVQRNQPLSMEELYAAVGMEPPPPGAIL